MVINNTFPPSASKVPTSALFEQDFKASRRTVICVLLCIVSCSKHYRLGNGFQMEIFIENKKQ